MKIWLDTTPQSNHSDGDCDCSGSQSMPTRIIWPPVDDEMVPTRALTLEHAIPLYVQSCDDERWVVCNPTGVGRIAVFDVQAIALLSLFATPMTLSQATQMLLNWSPESVERLVTLFYHLGLLRDSRRPPQVPVEQAASRTLSAWLHVTNACNLRCHYCYIHKTPEAMPPDVGREAIDAVFRSALKNGYKNIRLKYAGGEASLHMLNVVALHDYAVERAREHGITLGAVILSNGVVLSQRAIEQLKERHIAITLSLDGLGSYHDSQRPLLGGKGSSYYVLRTIDRLLANEIVPAISVTVSRRNLAGLPALMHYILERALPFSLNYYREHERSARIADLRFADEQVIAAMRAVFRVIEERLPAQTLLGCLLDKADITAPHQHTCGVGQNYLVIDQHGSVAKCQMEIERPITTIAADDPLQSIREDRRGVQGLAVTEKDGCRTCEWRNWCAGGCPVMTYRATGRYDIKSPNCTIYKTLFPEVLRLEALRLLRYTRPLSLERV